MFETQVLLPASFNYQNICFAGPYFHTLDYEAISIWFPTYENEHPIIHKETIRNDFLKEKVESLEPLPLKIERHFLVGLLV